ncbi:hypothetical protein [Halobellus limi]|uniref:hypothetical protein n=1 Tax=Halobellus limi TaxID=699433 RepID=UPI002689FFC1
MSESEDPDTTPKLSVAVVDKTHANEIPDNIDSELYTTTRPESSLVESRRTPTVSWQRRSGGTGSTYELIHSRWVVLSNHISDASETP